MTPADLQSAAKKLFGERGYSAALAKFLGRERTQVWRYLTGRVPIPDLVARAVEARLGSFHLTKSEIAAIERHGRESK